MNCERVVLLEGYDGAGKSTLISSIKASGLYRSARMIGRKNEPLLSDISLLIERDHPRFEPRTEILLRYALEFERLQLIAKAANECDLVLVDRSVLSVAAWPHHYNVLSPDYDGLTRGLIRCLAGSTLILCHAPFDLCWERIDSRPDKSRKELMGRDENRRYHEEFYRSAREYEQQNPPFRWLNVRSDIPIADTIAAVLKHLADSR
jgi:thymidylate kinase